MIREGRRGENKGSSPCLTHVYKILNPPLSLSKICEFVCVNAETIVFQCILMPHFKTVN